MYSAAYSRSNPLYLAVVGKQASNGLVQYSNDGGSTWLNFIITNQKVALQVCGGEGATVLLYNELSLLFTLLSPLIPTRISTLLPLI